MTKIANIGDPGKLGITLENVDATVIADVGTSGLNAAITAGQIYAMSQTAVAAISGSDITSFGTIRVPLSADIGAVSVVIARPMCIALEDVPIGTAAQVLVRVRVRLQGDYPAAVCTGAQALEAKLVANTSKQLAAQSAVGQRILAIATGASFNGDTRVPVLFDGQGLFNGTAVCAS